MFGIVAAILLGVSVVGQSINTIADVAEGRGSKILLDAPLTNIALLAIVPSLFQKKKSGRTPNP
jgi:hypothetical protein